jgi:hypothetical protein
MRLNRLGVKLIAVFAAVGLAFVGLAIAGAPGAIVFWVLGIAYLLGVAISIFVAIRSRLRARHRRWLAANGLRGHVTVVEAASEMSINEQPVFELVADLSVPGLEPRRVRRTLIVGSFAARRMRPGTVLPAYVNPRDPDDLLIVW